MSAVMHTNWTKMWTSFVYFSSELIIVFILFFSQIIAIAIVGVVVVLSVGHRIQTSNHSEKLKKSALRCWQLNGLSYMQKSNAFINLEETARNHIFRIKDINLN